MIHAWQYLGESGFDDLLKTAAEEREKKSRISLNRETAITGLKLMGIAGLAGASGVLAAKGIGYGLQATGLLKDVKDQHLAKAVGALGTAIPMAYALQRRFGEEQLRDADQRSKELKLRAGRPGP